MAEGSGSSGAGAANGRIPERLRNAYGRLSHLGLTLIPLPSSSKRPYPWMRWKNITAQKVEWWWAKAPLDSNMAVLTGSLSQGLIIIDVDKQETWDALFGLPVEEVAERTIVVRTGRGFHVYAWAPPGARSQNLLLPSGGEKVGDVQFDGKYAVVPPSIHPDTLRPYEFVGEVRVVAALADLKPLFDVTASTVRVPAAKPKERSARTRSETRKFEITPPTPDDLLRVNRWATAQKGRFLEAWAVAQGQTPKPEDWERSGPDFVIAKCLLEGKFRPSLVAGILLSLPQSKAREENRPDYALLTVMSALWTFFEREAKAWKVLDVFRLPVRTIEGVAPTAFQDGGGGQDWIVRVQPGEALRLALENGDGGPEARLFKLEQPPEPATSKWAKGGQLQVRASAMDLAKVLETLAALIRQATPHPEPNRKEDST